MLGLKVTGRFRITKTTLTMNKTGKIGSNESLGNCPDSLWLVLSKHMTDDMSQPLEQDEGESRADRISNIGPDMRESTTSWSEKQAPGGHFPGNFVKKLHQYLVEANLIAANGRGPKNGRHQQSEREPKTAAQLSMS